MAAVGDIRLLAKEHTIITSSGDTGTNEILVELVLYLRTGF